MSNVMALPATPARTAQDEFLHWLDAASRAADAGAKCMADAADFYEEAGSARAMAWEVAGLSDWDMSQLADGHVDTGPDQGIVLGRQAVS